MTVYTNLYSGAETMAGIIGRGDTARLHPDAAAARKRSHGGDLRRITGSAG
ncbi:MAG: hypothetical protein NVS2B15_19720 [Pseudarthrobacter sp.]